MNKSSKRRIVIDFDLTVKECRAVFGGSRSKAYRVLKKDLTQNGFIHDQGSSYVSEKPLSQIETTVTMIAVFSRNPWLGQCCKKLRVSRPAEDIFNGQAHDILIQMLGELAANDKPSKSIKKKALSKKATDNAPKPPSFAEISEQYKDYKPQPKPRSSGKGSDKKPPNRGNSGR